MDDYSAQTGHPAGRVFSLAALKDLREPCRKPNTLAANERCPDGTRFERRCSSDPRAARFHCMQHSGHPQEAMRNAARIDIPACNHPLGIDADGYSTLPRGGARASNVEFDELAFRRA